MITIFMSARPGYDSSTSETWNVVFVFLTVTPDDGPITTSLNSQRRHSTY